MGRLSSEQVLRDQNTDDSSSISSLKLNHKALSDVSCLKNFINLQRLDLGFNNLTSLEDLKPCVNLKWLSVVQNKLQSLKGIEGLSKLLVLNAGKNKLTTMDEVRFLVSLRAVILNDNEITAICKLDHLKDLNTIVLSRNPICSIGEAMIKSKSVTKVSLSNCELEAIDLSFKCCTELKELRLAHNHIKALHAHLARNIKLQNLDLGNNLITGWSDLKVLKSLINLRNLNLQGNPIVGNEKSMRKIMKALPNLQIFNAKPINKNPKKTDKRRIEAVDDLSLNKSDEEEAEDGAKGDRIMQKKAKNKVKILSEENEGNDAGEDHHLEDRKWKRHRRKDDSLKKAAGPKEDQAVVEKKTERKSKKEGNKEIDVIDDAEAPFVELFESESAAEPNFIDQNGGIGKSIEGIHSQGGATLIPVKKKKKSKSRGPNPSEFQMPTVEVGMGGPSTWDD